METGLGLLGRCCGPGPGGVTAGPGPGGVPAGSAPAGESGLWALAPSAAPWLTDGPVPFLVEEYVPGPEVSVQLAVWEGRPLAVSVTAKETGPLPYFQKTAITVPAPLSPAQRRAAEDAAVLAVRAVGMEQGGAYVEMRLAVGGPRVIEVGARIEGDRIPQMVREVTGADLVGAALWAALGERRRFFASLSQRRRRSRIAGGACLRFFFPPAPGVVRGFLGVDAAARSPGVVEVDLTPVGTRLGCPPEAFTDRLGFVRALAPRPELARARAEAAAGLIVAQLDAG
ncbi:MAG: ATP-grasp domain-containing protein [Acetobacteraceae bacterium]|nr:ATP-grasp domain-containing protein [Acetobacteraceae bacterium]